MEDNIIKVKRLITKFIPREDDRKAEFDVTHAPFDVLKSIFPPKAGDPLLYDSYKLETNQAANLQPYISEKLDLNKFEYYLEAEANK